MVTYKQTGEAREKKKLHFLLYRNNLMEVSDAENKRAEEVLLRIEYETRNCRRQIVFYHM